MYLWLVCLPKALGERRKQLKSSPPSLVAYPRFLLLLPSVYSAHSHRNRVVPPVREESTSIASFACLTTSVDIPAIDTYVHAPYRSIVHAHARIAHRFFTRFTNRSANRFFTRFTNRSTNRILQSIKRFLGSMNRCI